MPMWCGSDDGMSTEACVTGLTKLVDRPCMSQPHSADENAVTSHVKCIQHVVVTNKFEMLSSFFVLIYAFQTMAVSKLTFFSLQNYPVIHVMLIHCDLCLLQTYYENLPQQPDTNIYSQFFLVNLLSFSLSSILKLGKYISIVCTIRKLKLGVDLLSVVEKLTVIVCQICSLILPSQLI